VPYAYGPESRPATPRQLSRRFARPRMSSAVLAGVLLATTGSIVTLASATPAGAVARTTAKAVGARAAEVVAVKAQHIAPSVTWPAPQWVSRTATGADLGYVAQSSPTAATFAGRSIVAVGAENGYVYVTDAATGAELPGWPEKMAAPAGQSIAIESSPTIAWLDGPGKPPSIVVGSGSTWVPNSVGEVEAFRLDGAERWAFRVGAAPGTAIGVISSPAVGDLTGNGAQDVVFGSWDHNIYALNSAGNVLPGFPYNNADTIWSSPSLYRLPGHKGDDIFLGSDASGRIFSLAGGSQRCVGGFVGDYRYVAGTVVREWFHCENQSIWSSPVVGVIGSSHRPVVVVGTSFYEQPFPSDTDKVFAYYADSGAAVPGWPVTTVGPALGSPAIGVIDGSGQPAVVETSWVCAGPKQPDCFAGNRSEVYAWNGSGGLIWSHTLMGPTDLGSPVLVPLQGHTTDDVLVGSPNGLYPLDGATGAYLFGTNGTNQFAAINPGCRVFNSVAVADLPGTGPRAGWHVFEACGGPRAFQSVGELASYRLPVQPSTAAAWPMFRGSPEHDGVAFASLPGTPIDVPGVTTTTSATTAAICRVGATTTGVATGRATSTSPGASLSGRIKRCTAKSSAARARAERALASRSRSWPYLAVWRLSYQ
jgi:hypothetical protein